jgi:hypothetical protein
LELNDRIDEEETDSNIESSYILYSETDIEQYYYDKEQENERNKTHHGQAYPVRKKPKPSEDAQEAVYPKRRHAKSR